MYRIISFDFNCSYNFEVCGNHEFFIDDEAVSTTSLSPASSDNSDEIIEDVSQNQFFLFYFNIIETWMCMCFFQTYEEESPSSTSFINDGSISLHSWSDNNSDDEHSTERNKGTSLSPPSSDNRDEIIENGENVSQNHFSCFISI